MVCTVHCEVFAFTVIVPSSILDREWTTECSRIMFVVSHFSTINIVCSHHKLHACSSYANWQNNKYFKKVKLNGEGQPQTFVSCSRLNQYCKKNFFFNLWCLTEKTYPGTWAEPLLQCPFTSSKVFILHLQCKCSNQSHSRWQARSIISLYMSKETVILSLSLSLSLSLFLSLSLARARTHA